MKYTKDDIAKFQDTLFWSMENAKQLNDDATYKELVKISDLLDNLEVEGAI